jgi:hypothetical protein
MYVVACFQWFWQCGEYIDIQGLVAALRMLGLREQSLDLTPVYSEPGNTESHLRERAESVHCIAMLLPHTYFINKSRVSNEYPTISTQTGSLMFSVGVFSEDCGLG